MTLEDAFLGLVLSIGVAIMIVGFIGLIAGCILATITDRWEGEDGE